MQVLIIEDSATDALALERIASGDGHVVTLVKSVADAKKTIAATSYDVILIDWTLPDGSGDAVARYVREKSERYVYVIFVTGRSMEHMGEAVAAGADDYIQKPVHRNELVARLHAAARIVHLERGLRERVAELESALRRLDASAAMKGIKVAQAVAASSIAPRAVSIRPHDGALPKELVDTKTWRSLDECLRRVLAEYFQGNFNTAPPTAAGEEPYTASIALTNVRVGITIELNFTVSRATAFLLGGRLFGDEMELEDAMLRDIIGELSNTAMGALKAGFASDGDAFTAGLPTTGTGETVAPHGAPLWHRELGFSDDAASVSVAVNVLRSPVREVLASQLREGIILSKDVLDARGILLLTAGTRITATHAERLKKFAPSTRVEVVDAAA